MGLRGLFLPVPRIPLQQEGLGHRQPLPEGEGAVHLPQLGAQGGGDECFTALQFPGPAPGGAHHQPQGHGGQTDRRPPAKDPAPVDVPHRLSLLCVLCVWNNICNEREGI